uniref:Dimethyladenosine transferase 2, mitochondrial n=2 Tax=Tetranychus urticae TaxID=32264 RepID=T1K8W2_TETUR
MLEFSSVKFMNSTSKLLRSCFPVYHHHVNRAYYANRKNNNKLVIPASSERIHLVDAEVIKFTVDSISSDWSKETAIVIDTSPGPGLLLEALLKAGAPKVRGLLHGSSPYKSVLQTLQETYPDRLELRNFDFHNFRSNFKENSGIEGCKRVLDSALETAPVNWTDDPPLKLILTLTPSTERRVLRRLISELTLQSGIYASGRSQLFVFLSEKEYGFMKTKKDVRPIHHQASHILYQSFFQINHLATFNFDCFYPSVNNPKTKNSNPENVHLVSILPKLELPDLISTKDWPDYFYFVKQTMARRRNRIIPFMEKLVSDCGLKLIKNGITVHKAFKDLEPDEFIKLFVEMRSWPEFEVSNLAEATKGFLTENDQYLLQHGFSMNKK